MCNLDSPLGQPVYDQVPTGLWLHDLVWRKRGLLLCTLDLKVLIRGVVLNIAWKGLVFIAKIEEITVIGLMLT